MTLALEWGLLLQVFWCVCVCVRSSAEFPEPRPSDFSIVCQSRLSLRPPHMAIEPTFFGLDEATFKGIAEYAVADSGQVQSDFWTCMGACQNLNFETQGGAPLPGISNLRVDKAGQVTGEGFKESLSIPGHGDSGGPPTPWPVWTFMSTIVGSLVYLIYRIWNKTPWKRALEELQSFWNSIAGISSAMAAGCYGITAVVGN